MPAIVQIHSFHIVKQTFQNIGWIIFESAYFGEEILITEILQLQISLVTFKRSAITTFLPCGQQYKATKQSSFQ